MSRTTACVVIALLRLGPVAHAQSADPVKFDVASIRPNNSGATRSGFGPGPGGGLKATNVTPMSLITFAYDMRDFQVEGGPGWVRSDRFDILATIDRGGASTQGLDGSDRFFENREPLRNLLQERFGLQVRRSTKELPAYLLTASKGGPKLKASTDAANPHMFTGNGVIEAAGIKLDGLTHSLSNILGRKVVDQTGLTGAYDLKLEWSPEGSESPTGASLFTAMQEQLGLKLESKKLPVEIIVIERVEKPSKN